MSDLLSAQDMTFENINYKAEPLCCREFENCIFKTCDFSDCDISNTEFTNCRFEYCNLAMVKTMDTGFKDVKFTGCKLTGVDFSTCSNFLFSIDCADCNMSYTSFLKKRLKRTTFKNCLFSNALFAQCDLSEALFMNCDLREAIFEQNNMERADFSTSFNYTIDPENNRLKKARFSKEHIAGLLYKYNLDIK